MITRSLEEAAVLARGSSLFRRVRNTALSLSDIGVTTFNACLETVNARTRFLVGTVFGVGRMILVDAVGLGAMALAWTYALGAVAVGTMALFFPRHSPRNSSIP